MKFAGRLKELRETKKISMYALGEKIGVSDAAICKWENAITEPKASNILSLADFFEVSTDYLLGTENELGIKKYSSTANCPTLSTDERKLLDNYRKLNKSNKTHVSVYAEIRLEEQDSPNDFEKI